MGLCSGCVGAYSLVCACPEFVAHPPVRTAADGPPAQIRDSASKRWCRDDPAYMNAKHQRHDSSDEGNRTASTDTSGSDREPLDEDAASLASIMMSIASSCGKRPFQSQPSSAETVRATMSASSSVTNDDEDEDEGPADSVQIKKQRRREKNRASAQQSRQRKKCHLETLETRVADLERERAALLARVEALSVENCLLRRAPSEARPEQAVRLEEAAAVGPCTAGAPVAALGAATTVPKQVLKAAGAVHGGSSLGLMAGRVAAAGAMQGAGLLDQLARAASTMS